MRRIPSLGLLILAVITALAAGTGALPRVTAQGGEPVPTHLVLSVDNGSDARINRMDWDVNGWSPLLPATAVRPNDYIDLAGRTTVIVLCTDLV
ncbi:MAG: hypothetical protein JW910_19745, partial [Anaerolineae bacterium]|nr:hypothetical protein [Anaerolineae bacterium]